MLPYPQAYDRFSPRAVTIPPNLLHLYFHALFAINLAFALALRLGKL